MNRSTISRLKSRKAKEPGDEVPQRRTGSGRQRKHGMKELIAIEEAMEHVELQGMRPSTSNL